MSKTPETIASQARREIGQVISGSLVEGLKMKLNPGQSVEDIRAGKFVVVRGEKHEFFSMITDVILETSSSGLLDNPPRQDDELLKLAVSGTTTYGTVQLRPMLMLPIGKDEEPQEELRPVKTIPGHFSPVYSADSRDVSRIFGEEGEDNRFFHIGVPLDMEDTPVCLNLERFVERSNGIFGKSGTGKTFLTRIVLCGIIKNNRAVNLIFDMHNEYGWEGNVEDPQRPKVRGLKQYFQDRVAVFTLDRESSKRRGSPVDFEVQIPYSQITPEDIILLQEELNLNPTTLETCYPLMANYKEKWFRALVEMTPDQIKEFCTQNNVHQRSLEALQRKLLVLKDSCEGFLLPDEEITEKGAISNIIKYLQSGKHVVIEFGQHSRPLQYMLVANILTRRIHETYVRLTEEWMGEAGPRPIPLVITIEEAHKFLNPTLSRQTIFGTIAREMRKYNVTLLVVDQRPSGIDPEILSQVGTRITCLLNDEKDIEAVLTGVSNAQSLRAVLASLDSKQQALIIGHAVPMPIVIQTRVYDDEPFRKSMVQGMNPKSWEEIEREMSIDFS